MTLHSRAALVAEIDRLREQLMAVHTPPYRPASPLVGRVQLYCGCGAYMGTVSGTLGNALWNKLLVRHQTHLRDILGTIR